MLISFLVYLLIAVIVLCLALWVLQELFASFSVPAPIPRLVRVLIIAIFAIAILARALPLLGGGHLL